MPVPESGNRRFQSQLILDDRCLTSPESQMSGKIFDFFSPFLGLKNNVTVTFRDFLKSWAPDTYLYAKKDHNISYSLLLEIQVPKSASKNHHIGLSGRHKTLETTGRANTTRLRVPDGSNQGFEPDNRPLDHFSGSGGSEDPLTSCLTTA